MSDAAYTTTVNVHLPDCPGAVIRFLVSTDVALAVDTGEVFPYRWPYALTLDGDGAGSIALPTPDNTGVAAFSYTVLLLLNNRKTFPLSYSIAAQELSDLLAAVAAAEPAAVSILSALSWPTTCYCAMSIPVAIPPNQEVLVPMQVVGQMAAIHPGGISGTLTMQAKGLYDFQATVYTDAISLAGYYFGATLRKNEEAENNSVGLARQDGLASASVMQVLTVAAPAVQMDVGDTMELYILHNYTAPIACYVSRLVVVRRGSYA